MGKPIAIVDYGVGNLQSVANAMAYLGFQTQITARQEQLEQAGAIILPGVGAFPDAYAQLERRGLPKVLRAQAEKKPILGICLGMQMLFDGSDEIRPCRGLGLIPGWVKRIETTRKLPHIGWNNITFPNKSPLFQHLSKESYVYFVHTFAGQAASSSDVIAETYYGTTLVAAVGRGMVFGCQFHPEKSGETGLAILKNFGELIK
ncbi:MAG: imidazole glycerol phosphate synthase subunit HisH [Oscillospiraceae bacterium]|jgi:glutamine amidotransferase